MSAAAADRALAFRALHRAERGFILPNPWDVGSAKVLAAAGFAAMGSTSAGHAYACGTIDAGLDRATMIAGAADLAAAVEIPVAADLLNGFGPEPQTVMETIRLAAATPLAGCSIEDTEGRSAYDRDAAIARVEAAVAAVKALDRPFVLTARADGVLIGAYDLDEAIARLQAFEAAGAEVVYAPGLRTLDEVRRVRAAVACPLNVLAAPGELADLGALLDLGVTRVSTGSALYIGAMAALSGAAAALKAGRLDLLRPDAAFGGREVHTLMR